MLSWQRSILGGRRGRNKGIKKKVRANNFLLSLQTAQHRNRQIPERANTREGAAGMQDFGNPCSYIHFTYTKLKPQFPPQFSIYKQKFNHANTEILLSNLDIRIHGLNTVFATYASLDKIASCWSWNSLNKVFYSYRLFTHK